VRPRLALVLGREADRTVQIALSLHRDSLS
jgi:hypothetical protein